MRNVAIVIYLVRDLELLALTNVRRFGDRSLEAVEGFVVQGLMDPILSATTRPSDVWPDLLAQAHIP